MFIDLNTFVDNYDPLEFEFCGHNFVILDFEVHKKSLDPTIKDPIKRDIILRKILRQYNDGMERDLPLNPEEIDDLYILLCQYAKN